MEASLRSMTDTIKETLIPPIIKEFESSSTDNDNGTKEITIEWVYNCGQQGGCYNGHCGPYVGTGTYLGFLQSQLEYLGYDTFKCREFLAIREGGKQGCTIVIRKKKVIS